MKEKILVVMAVVICGITAIRLAQMISIGGAPWMKCLWYAATVNLGIFIANPLVHLVSDEGTKELKVFTMKFLWNLMVIISAAGVVYIILIPS